MTVSMNRKVIDPKIEQNSFQILSDLPPAKVVDVRDYILFGESLWLFKSS